jgi:hypothetical protein
LKRLSADAFERARGFLQANGRPIERAGFAAEFENGAREDVWSAVAAYQNDDGGFGNGIEPDFRLPDSSPMATSVAFIILGESGADSTLEVVQRGIAYLVASVDEALPGWRPVPIAVNDYPHAPWWTRSPEAFREPVPAADWGNPNAELIGVLSRHRGGVDTTLVDALLRSAVERLENATSPATPYVALSYLRLAEGAPADVAEAVTRRLQSDARQILDLDREKLEAEHFPPWWLAPTPDAPLAGALEDVIAWDLDRQIGRQGDDGSWSPPWAWGPEFPDAWERARVEWQSELTLRTLRLLAAYDRIDS